MAVRVVDTKEDARKRFETFYDRKSKRTIERSFTWPKEFQEIGIGRAELYDSNKWKRDLREYESYKHIVESNRAVYVEPGWLRSYGSPREKIEVYGPMCTPEEPMPKHYTRLGDLLGVQVQLYDEDLRIRKGCRIYEVRASRAELGAATHPVTGEIMLLVADREGVHMLLTGSGLDVERDGIVG